MPELTPIVAFAGGLVSFFAPCVAPVVPGYVTFIAGGPGASRTRRFVLTSAFVLGFSAAFVALGLLIGAVGSSPVFQGFERWLQWIGGALIVAFGLAMVGLLRVPFLERDLRFHGRTPAWLGPGGAGGGEASSAPSGALGAVLHGGGAFVLGLAFGVGWSPCIGPVLAGILLLAGVSGTAASGALLLVAFSLGLAVPFLLLGFSAERGAALVRRFARAARGIEVAGGVLLVLVGIAVFTGALGRLTSYVVG